MKGASTMSMLAIHPCLQIHHEIGPIEKRIVEHCFDMKLFRDELTVNNESFPVRCIFDISYRKKPDSDVIGFVYLHTNKGVRTYYTREEPDAFIQAFQDLSREIGW